MLHQSAYTSSSNACIVVIDDIDAMLHESQPRNFRREDDHMDKSLKDKSKTMDEYFDLAQSNDDNREIITSFKLKNIAKLW